MIILYRGSCVWFVFFFFQAEDGIRDYKVTGVQTCALPISIDLRLPCLEPAIRLMVSSINVPPMSFTPPFSTATQPSTPSFTHEHWMLSIQIGRASCRERV